MLLSKKLRKKEKRIDKLQNAIHKHQRQAHVCGEHGDIQKEQRHFDIIDSLIEKTNGLGKEIEDLQRKIPPLETVIKRFQVRLDDGPYTQEEDFVREDVPF